MRPRFWGRQESAMARIGPPAGQQSSVLVSGGLLHAACSSALQQDAYLRYRGELYAGDSGHMSMNRKYKINLGISMRAPVPGRATCGQQPGHPCRRTRPAPGQKHRTERARVKLRSGGGAALLRKIGTAIAFLAIDGCFWGAAQMSKASGGGGPGPAGTRPREARRPHRTQPLQAPGASAVRPHPWGVSGVGQLCFFGFQT